MRLAIHLEMRKRYEGTAEAEHRGKDNQIIKIQADTLFIQDAVDAQKAQHHTEYQNDGYVGAYEQNNPFHRITPPTFSFSCLTGTSRVQALARSARAEVNPPQLSIIKHNTQQSRVRRSLHHGHGRTVKAVKRFFMRLNTK
jgi:hypothetical protein